MKIFLNLLFTCSFLQAACIPPPNNYDWEANRWKQNIGSVSGTLSGASYRNGTIYMKQSKVFGVRSLLGRVNLYLGDFTGFVQCIIYDWGTGVSGDTLHSFVSGDYSESTGLTGGNLKYLETTLVPFSFTVATNFHQACYVRTASNTAVYEMGLLQGRFWAIAQSYSDSKTYLQFGSEGSLNASDSAGTGLYTQTRGSTTFAAIYRGTTELVSNTGSDTGSLDSGGVATVVHAVISSGVVTAWSTKAQSYYSVGKYLSTNDIAKLKIMVEGVQQRAGRKV